LASIGLLAFRDAEPRTMKVSLSSAARPCSGPWSGTIAAASTTHAPMTTQRERALAVSEDSADST
jgi:hypothetical protein